MKRRQLLNCILAALNCAALVFFVASRGTSPASASASASDLSASPVNSPSSASPATWHHIHALLAPSLVPGSDLIPALVHQTYLSHPSLDWHAVVTNDDKRRAWFESWEHAAPDSAHIVWDSASALSFLSERLPSTHVQAFALLPHYVVKGDFLRYALLYEFGGVYSDADTVCHKPVSQWLRGHEDAQLIVAVWDFKGFRRHPQNTNLVQWTMAAMPHHPLLKSIVDNLAAKILAHPNITTLSGAEVDDFTGPNYWTKSISDYLNSFGESFDDLESPASGHAVEHWFPGSKTLILPINSFRADSSWAHGFGVDHELSFVSHVHTGSWDAGWKNVFDSEKKKQPFIGDFVKAKKQEPHNLGQNS
ncbi:membrane-bound alpha-1,6- mannosyltransferase Initiation-specific [Entophlyctis luteolus]|nr:membrane-bound alpha-1,6- mannosyltransferase Initiation-specific [Entophlyctis luteolus]